MDFVTITDHDTIDGCLELADRPDCFVSEELTARFAGEPQAVHVLCYGITPGDHEWLQAHAGDVEACAAYLARERDRLRARAPVLQRRRAARPARHRRRLAELFPIWEVRNGSRAAELNMPAVDLHRDARGHRDRRLRRSRRRGHRPHLHRGAGRIHAGRVSATACAAARPRPGGEQGSAAKWAHAAMALATRALGSSTGRAPERARRPDPAAVLKIAQRVIGEGAAREGKVAADIGPDDAARCSRPGCARSGSSCAAASCSPTCSPRTSPTPTSTGAPAASTSAACAPRSARAPRRSPRGDVGGRHRRPLRALLPAVPYAPADRLPRRREGEARGRPASGRGSR